MNRIDVQNLFLTVLSATCLSLFLNGQAAAEALTSCTMTYKLSGFSLAIKQYDGFGNISCSNGEQARVALSSTSIGFSIGKSEIEGTGTFSDVRKLKEIYGTYAALEGHAGAVSSFDGQVLTRGQISLALSGQGHGIDIGVTIGALTISRPQNN